MKKSNGEILYYVIRAILLPWNTLNPGKLWEPVAANDQLGDQRRNHEDLALTFDGFFLTIMNLCAVFGCNSKTGTLKGIGSACFYRHNCYSLCCLPWFDWLV